MKLSGLEFKDRFIHHYSYQVSHQDIFQQQLLSSTSFLRPTVPASLRRHEATNARPREPYHPSVDGTPGDAAEPSLLIRQKAFQFRICHPSCHAPPGPRHGISKRSCPLLIPRAQCRQRGEAAEFIFLFPPAIPRQLYGKAPRCACNRHRRLDRSLESWRARRRKAAVRSLVCPWSSFPTLPRCPPCPPPRSPRDCSGLLAPRVGGHLPPVAHALLLFLRDVLSGSSKGRRHACQNSLAEIRLHHPPDLATVLPSSLPAPASGGGCDSPPPIWLRPRRSRPSSPPPFSYSRTVSVPLARPSPPRRPRPLPGWTSLLLLAAHGTPRGPFTFSSVTSSRLQRRTIRDRVGECSRSVLPPRGWRRDLSVGRITHSPVINDGGRARRRQPVSASSLGRKTSCVERVERPPDFRTFSRSFP